MAKLIHSGDAIEGASVSGSSRDPLRARKPQILNGVRCHVWTATFNVRSQVTSVLPPGVARIYPAASLSPSDEVLCDKAFVFSVKDRFADGLDHRSSTHKASTWDFPKQTVVLIDGPHEELVNASSKKYKP